MGPTHRHRLSKQYQNCLGVSSANQNQNSNHNPLRLKGGSSDFIIDNLRPWTILFAVNCGLVGGFSCAMCFLLNKWLLITLSSLKKREWVIAFNVFMNISSWDKMLSWWDSEECLPEYLSDLSWTIQTLADSKLLWEPGLSQLGSPPTAPQSGGVLLTGTPCWLRLIPSLYFTSPFF